MRNAAYYNHTMHPNSNELFVNFMLIFTIRENYKTITKRLDKNYKNLNNKNLDSTPLLYDIFIQFITLSDKITTIRIINSILTVNPQSDPIIKARLVFNLNNCEGGPQ